MKKKILYIVLGCVFVLAFIGTSIRKLPMKTSIAVSKVLTINDDNTLTGQVVNNTKKRIDVVYVKIILKDKTTGHTLDIATTLKNIPAKGTKLVYFTSIDSEKMEIKEISYKANDQIKNIPNKLRVGFKVSIMNLISLVPAGAACVLAILDIKDGKKEEVDQ